MNAGKLNEQRKRETNVKCNETVISKVIKNDGVSLNIRGGGDFKQRMTHFLLSCCFMLMSAMFWRLRGAEAAMETVTLKLRVFSNISEEDHKKELYDLLSLRRKLVFGRLVPGVEALTGLFPLPSMTSFGVAKNTNFIGRPAKV